MLDKAHRITSASDYKHVVRRGRRSAGGSTVTYTTKNPNGGEPRFGFIVAKTVGNAVTRNRVRRRLKALSHDVLQGTVVPKQSLLGLDLVFRALPSAAGASYDELRDDVARAVTQAATR
ncbi:ribonuclease P protein component [Paramicrobacterium fandaimingii]|uniref:ribonuclease P protein component n=1 Tax=Paramicrobacterium fandaimingii TaxID=2708079 RepID=UPI00141F607E|nr:ribonuclease P protein component [Microbacterium fandaimingii]